MATTEAALLSYVKTQIKGLSPSAPAGSTSRVFVTPDDYNDVSQSVPFVIVNRQQEAFTTSRRAHSGVMSNWNLEIFVFLHKGALVYPSADYAAAELKARQWWSAITDWIYGTGKPFSTHGAIAGDVTFDFVAMQFNQNPYNGLYVSVPVFHNL